MAKHYDHVVFDSVSYREPDIFTTPTSASAPAPAGSGTELSSGHSVAATSRDVGSGVVTTWTHVLASCMTPPSLAHVSLPAIPLNHPPPVPDPYHPPLP
jgi:hypothetical protein